MSTGGPYWTAVQLGPDHKPNNGTVIATGTHDDVMPYWQPGKVVICWNADPAPIRRLSKDALGSVRRKRLARRLTAKFPLFADQLIAAELAARPEHFYPGNPE